MAIRAGVEVGSTVPDFKVKSSTGAEFTMSALSGKKVILYFYPHDNTPTCTEEACNLRDNYKALLKAGFRLYGVSPDSIRKHQNFIKKFKLPFDLISDPSLDIIKKFGVNSREAELMLKAITPWR